MSWYSTGEEGQKKAEEFEANLALIRNAKKSFWFRLKRGETAKVTFLDDPLFFFRLHTVKIGDRYVPVTCIDEQEKGIDCPLCESGNYAGYVSAGTIINHNEFTSSKTGTTYKNQKQIIIFKGIARKTLIPRLLKKHGSLQYAVVDVERADAPKSLQSGDIFEFVKRLSVEKIKKFAPPDVNPDEWILPIDYSEEFKPLPIEELIKLAGGKLPERPAIGSDDDLLKGFDDEDVKNEDEITEPRDLV